MPRSLVRPRAWHGRTGRPPERERAEGTTLYCSACPCLACAKKIAQSGVRSVVYAEEYAMGHLTAALLSEAGVDLRRLAHGPPTSLSAPTALASLATAVAEVSFDDAVRA